MANTPEKSTVEFNRQVSQSEKGERFTLGTVDKQR